MIKSRCEIFTSLGIEIPTSCICCLSLPTCRPDPFTVAQKLTDAFMQYVLVAFSALTPLLDDVKRIWSEKLSVGTLLVLI